MLGTSEKSQMKSEQRFYLRYHNAISRAIELNKEIFGNLKGKDGKQLRFEHPLRVAGMCQEILDQTMEQYHMGWLVGILHDDKEHDPLLFSQRIDKVIEDLLPHQKKKVIQYIDQLSSDKQLTKGQQKRAQLEKIEKMELLPSWILIFDKYDNCVRFKKDPVGKSKQELEGYYSVAYLIYQAAREKHNSIRKHMIDQTMQFFEQMGKEVGGIKGAREKAEKYFNMMDK